MPQTAQQFNPAITPGGVPAPLQLDGSGNLKTTASATIDPGSTVGLDAGASAGSLVIGTVITKPQAASSQLNITSATVIKASAGTVVAVTVVVAGSDDGSVNDCLTTGAAAAANAIVALPTAAGAQTIPLNWPCGTGIVVVPGTGQTIAISFQ